MESLDAHLVEQALASLGRRLAGRQDITHVQLILAGGTAGLLGGLLRSGRTTADCDVMEIDRPEVWEAIAIAAAEVAKELDLPETWLNRQCENFAWCLPLGWQRRAETVGRFGPLEVRRLGRLDLIAAKVMGAPKRPQDLQDLEDLRPMGEELDFVSEHLDRLEHEDLDRRTFEDQRDIVEALRGDA